MALDQTRNDIWLGLWDAKRLARYYCALHRRYQRLGTALTAVLLLAGAASLLAAPELAPDYLRGILGCAIVAAAIWSALGR